MSGEKKQQKKEEEEKTTLADESSHLHTDTRKTGYIKTQKKKKPKKKRKTLRILPAAHTNIIDI